MNAPWDVFLVINISMEPAKTIRCSYALLGRGTETERAGRQEEAIELLEEARDVSFLASKNVAALVHAYLARAYASGHKARPFKKAIDIAEKIARDINLQYGDGTDFVFHSISGVMAEWNSRKCLTAQKKTA